MPDDAYEFLGPDLLAPPPAPPGTTASGRELPEAPKVEANELVPTSAAEKFEVQPAAPAPGAKRGSRSNSNEPSRPGRGKKARKVRSRKSERSGREQESGPPVPTFKGQMIFSVITVIASVALTIMVLVDGIF